MAASATVRAIGRAVSWSSVIGMMPWRLIRPTVGLIATSIFKLAGLSSEPEVSVPTFAAQKIAAVPMPELEPQGDITGRPSKVASCGSRLRDTGHSQEPLIRWYDYGFG